MGLEMYRENQATFDLSACVQTKTGDPFPDRQLMTRPPKINVRQTDSKQQE